MFEALSSPRKIQDFLAGLKQNPRQSMVLRSPQKVWESRTAHCIEGALFAAAALMHHGEAPLLMDLKASSHDYDHVVALFRHRGNWGAISTTHHPVLRYRDPIYATVRELALSYFHEYFLDDGSKTLRSYSDPFDLSRFGSEWVMASGNLWHISRALDRCRHHALVDRSMIASLRKADPLEIKAAKLHDKR